MQNKFCKKKYVNSKENPFEKPSTPSVTHTHTHTYFCTRSVHIKHSFNLNTAMYVLNYLFWKHKITTCSQLCYFLYRSEIYLVFKLDCFLYFSSIRLKFVADILLLFPFKFLHRMYVYACIRMGMIVWVCVLVT